MKIQIQNLIVEKIETKIKVKIKVKHRTIWKLERFCDCILSARTSDIKNWRIFGTAFFWVEPWTCRIPPRASWRARPPCGSRWGSRRSAARGSPGRWGGRAPLRRRGTAPGSRWTSSSRGSTSPGSPRAAAGTAAAAAWRRRRRKLNHVSSISIE